MPYDFAQLFRDNAVPHWTEGNNVSDGWVNTNCVFCDDPSNHLGFSEETGACACWRCGNHSTSEAIHILTGLEWQNIQTSYLTGGAAPYHKNDQSAAPPLFLSLPPGTRAMNQAHKKYLEDRLFDSDKLEREYDLQGTGMLGPYKFRIIIPIKLNGKLVSYQGRDYTGKAKLRYKTCKAEDEVVCHKHTLYDIDRAGNDIVVVEGVTDVWRLGKGAVATFGTGFTQEQILKLASFRRVFIMLDPDAAERADKLAKAVSGLGPDVEVVGIGCDPGDLPQDEADYLMKDLSLQ